MKATTVDFFGAINTVDTLGLIIKSGDIFVSLNGADFSLENWKKSENTGEILRGKDTLTIAFPNETKSLFQKINPALAGGLQSGDKIIRVNDSEVEFFDNITDALYFSRGEDATIVVERNGEEKSFSVNVSEKGTLGFFPVATDYFDKDAIQHIDYSFGKSLSRGLDRGITTLSDYVGQLKFIFTKKGASSIGGFGAIGNLFPSVWNWEVFWLNTALISIILAFMNILPIPALDGGHVVFLLYEMITGKEAPQKVLEYAQMVGFFILMGLLLYANGNDIYRYFFS